MQKLRAHGLTVSNILATPDETLNELIRAVGFHNNKVKYIKEASAILRDEHGGRVPDTMEGLLALPGVGPKMALICLNVNHGKVEGISVDTHVHRICNQLGWCGEGGTKQPEQTRRAIESWMPRDVWPHVNLLLVGLGQEVQTERPKLWQGPRLLGPGACAAAAGDAGRAARPGAQGRGARRAAVCGGGGALTTGDWVARAPSLRARRDGKGTHTRERGGPGCVPESVMHGGCVIQMFVRDTAFILHTVSIETCTPRVVCVCVMHLKRHERDRSLARARASKFPICATSPRTTRLAVRSCAHLRRNAWSRGLRAQWTQCHPSWNVSAPEV